MSSSPADVKCPGSTTCFFSSENVVSLCDSYFQGVLHVNFSLVER
jgi:hypothetical protein